MAEEELKDEDSPAATSGGSGKKGIIIIALAVITAIAVSIGATVYFLGGDDNDSPETLEEVNEESVEPVAKTPAIYFDIKPPFLVTYDIGGKQRYMQLYVSALSRTQSVLDALEHHMPLVRSKILSLYGSQKFEDLQTPEGKRALQSETLRVVNEVLENEGEQGIEEVYFTNFVLQ